MKRFVLIGFLVLLALAACDSTMREANRMVKRAELLADTLPDSTARLIDSVLRMPVSFKEKRRMDIALLQGEALFGDRGEEIPPLLDDEFFDGKPFLETSPDLERAADYYARKRQYAKAAHAALYSGFVQQHYGEKQAAMKSFKDAELYGEIESDSLSVAMAGYWMGKLLYYDGRKVEALSSLKNSIIHIGNHYAVKALIENSRAAVFLLLNQKDSVVTCLDKSLYNARKSHSAKAKHNVLNNYAVFYRRQGKYDQAIRCLRLIEDSCIYNEKELLLLNLNLGNVYFDKGKMDSANYYYKRIEPFMSTTRAKLETQLAAYDALFKFSTSRNEDSLALLYRERHEDILYAIMQQRQEQSIFRIQQQYDYENLQNTLNKKIILRHRIILIISLLLLTAAVLILVLQLRQKQMQEAEEELKRQIGNLKNDLQESVKASYLEKELSSRLRLIISAYRKRKKGYDPQNEWSSIVYKLMNGKENLFDAVLEEMEKVYPDIYTLLRQKYPELNETETKVCLLSCSDLSNTEIAEILGMSKFTIDKNRSKLREKLNLKPEKMKEQLHKAISH